MTTIRNIDTPIDRATVDELVRRGVLDHRAAELADAMLNEGLDRGRWASTALLGFGTALALAGVVFFFAFNWAALPDLAKLGLVEVGFVAAVLGGMLPQLSPNARRASTIAAGVLIGVFLAVFGQVYQTGADAWELFAGWAIAFLPFAALSRSEVGWALFAILASVAGSLFVEQSTGAGELALHAHAAVVAVTFGGVWVGLESHRSRRRVDWLHAMHTRTAFALATLGALALPELFASDATPIAVRVAHALVLLVASLVTWSRFGQAPQDTGVLGVLGLVWLALAVVRFGHLVFSAFDSAIFAAMLMVGFTLVCSSSLVAWLLRPVAERRAQ